MILGTSLQIVIQLYLSDNVSHGASFKLHYNYVTT